MLDFIDNWLKKNTSKNIGPVAMSGCIFTITNIEEQKEFQCIDECYTGDGNTCNRHWPYQIKKGKFVATRVVLNVIVTEAGNKGWRVENGDLKMLDKEGFSYDGFVLCDHIKDKKHHVCECGYIHPFTQGNIIYLFNLPKGAQIGGFIITNMNESVRFKYGDDANDAIFTKEFYNKLKVKLSATSQENQNNGVYDSYSGGSIVQEFELSKLQEDINYIKLQIHKRLNNDLLPSQQKQIEEKIDNKAYQIKLSIQSKGWGSSPDTERIVTDFYDALEAYEMQLSARRDFDSEREIRINKVSELLNVQPYMFEHISAKILKDQGYTSIKVTSRSNDRGIDIVCEKEGLRYVAQCKRYTSSVGSPDMQMFIGAMQNAGASNGIFITTSSFTKEAQLMANNNRVELVDKIKLAEWLRLDEDYIKEDNLFD